MNDRALLIGLGLAAVGLLGVGAPAVKRAITKGRTVGPDAGPDGLVSTPPDTLATQAGVSLEVLALARLMQSEAGTLPEIARIGVAWAARNQARATGTTVVRLLLGKEGRFGGQLPGRYAATGQAPTPANIALAGVIVSGGVLDPTGGAVQWDSPRAQRALLAKKARGYSKTPEDVARSRVAEGKELVALAGIDVEVIRFWRRRSKGPSLLG